MVGTVEVLHLDQDGQHLGLTDLYHGYAGMTYQTAAKNLSGYGFLRVEGRASGVFTGEVLQVRYIYQQLAPQVSRSRGYVLVKHLDHEGQELLAADVLMGPLRTRYVAYCKQLPGYHCHTSRPVLGSYRDELTIVTYCYRQGNDEVKGNR